MESGTPESVTISPAGAIGGSSSILFTTWLMNTPDIVEETRFPDSKSLCMMTAVSFFYCPAL